jgi:hypothetical protein
LRKCEERREREIERKVGEEGQSKNKMRERERMGLKEEGQGGVF